MENVSKGKTVTRHEWRNTKWISKGVVGPVINTIDNFDKKKFSPSWMDIFKKDWKEYKED